MKLQEQATVAEAARVRIMIKEQTTTEAAMWKVEEQATVAEAARVRRKEHTAFTTTEAARVKVQEQATVAEAARGKEQTTICISDEDSPV